MINVASMPDPFNLPPGEYFVDFDTLVKAEGDTRSVVLRQGDRFTVPTRTTPEGVTMPDESYLDWALRERSYFYTQMFVERDRAERAEAKLAALREQHVGQYGCMGEPTDVQNWLANNYSRTPFRWTLAQINEARVACGVKPYDKGFI